MLAAMQFRIFGLTVCYLKNAKIKIYKATILTDVLNACQIRPFKLKQKL
jgi:hypothetical protein